ncbi:DUF5712 family protein [Aquimarina macrocephali]|uniref:DUF5712 family protein n=1 Tax=Aquimarina macrocephali TaxID=666563 RepID=UPI003F6741DA
MIIKIQTSEKSNGNKGSSTAFANYLEKEDLAMEREAFDKGELPMPRAGFFSQENDGIMRNDVIQAIDTNKKGLGRNASKFYGISIAPSQKEQQHILKNMTGRNIKSIQELTNKEQKQYEAVLKEYSKLVMTEYAMHLKRPGLNDGSQLVYFGKVEHSRTYRGSDQEVKSGLAKSNSIKPGLNSHVHVIVSRKDKDMKLKLSPMTEDKGKEKKCITNGVPTQRGFDRNLFNIKAEAIFDKAFNYKRELNEKVEYRIEATKDPIKNSQIKLTSDNNRKQQLQQELINQYDSRNSYLKDDKNLSQNIKPVIEKQKNNELSI